MKRIQNTFGIALASGIIGLSGAILAQPATAQAAAAGHAAVGSTISKDDPDNEEGDDTDPSEGTGVVDPVPQDDGSDGVDDGTGDAS